MAKKQAPAKRAPNDYVPLVTADGKYIWMDTLVTYSETPGSTNTKAVVIGFEPTDEVRIRYLDSGLERSVASDQLTSTDERPFEDGSEVRFVFPPLLLESESRVGRVIRAWFDKSSSAPSAPKEWFVDLDVDGAESLGIPLSFVLKIEVQARSKAEPVAVASSEPGQEAKTEPDAKDVREAELRDFLAKRIRKGTKVSLTTSANPSGLCGKFQSLVPDTAPLTALVAVNDRKPATFIRVPASALVRYKKDKDVWAQRNGEGAKAEAKEKKTMKKAAKDYVKAARKGEGKAPKALKIKPANPPIPFPTSKSMRKFSAADLNAVTQARLTKRGVIVVAPVHGLIRVKDYKKPDVEGVTVLGNVVTVRASDLRPATKTEVESYKSQFKAHAKVGLRVGDAVAHPDSPKKLYGFVAATEVVAAANLATEVATFKIKVAALDDASGVHSENLNDYVPFKGKLPRFEDVPLFGAFLDKKFRPLVKVSKSNAVACSIAGSVSAPVAKLATSTSKLGSGAIRRFKKSDRVIPYFENFTQFQG